MVLRGSTMVEKASSTVSTPECGPASHEIAATHPPLLTYSPAWAPACQRRSRAGAPTDRYSGKGRSVSSTADSTSDRRSGRIDRGRGWLPLSARPGANGAWGDIDVHAHHRGTDISPLAW